MANESIANGIIIIHKDFWNEPKIQRMIIDVFEEYSDTNYNILTNLDYLRKTNKTAKDLELEFKGTGRWTFDSTLENVFKYGFEEFEDYEYFKETIKNFNAKDIYPMIFEFSDNDPFVGFYIEQIMKLTVVSFPTFETDIKVDARKGFVLSDTQIKGHIPLDEAFIILEEKFKDHNYFENFIDSINEDIEIDTEDLYLSPWDNKFISEDYLIGKIYDELDIDITTRLVDYKFEDEDEFSDEFYIPTILPEPYFYTKAFGDILINKKLWDTKNVRSLIEDNFINLDFGKKSYFKILNEGIYEQDNVEYHILEFETYLPSPEKVKGISDLGHVILDPFISFTDCLIDVINEKLPKHKYYYTYKNMANTLLINNQFSIFINYIEHDGFIANYEIKIYDDISEDNIDLEWYYSIHREFKRLDLVSTGEFPGYEPEKELLDKLEAKYPSSKISMLKEKIKEDKETLLLEGDFTEFWLDEEGCIKLLES